MTVSDTPEKLWVADAVIGQLEESVIRRLSASRLR